MKDIGWSAKITVDGTDCKIQEPLPFDRKWFSHKFKGPGVRYEIGICIQTGWIVWVNGPFPCGRYPDLKIARLGLIPQLDDGEHYVADGGYRDQKGPSITPSGFNTVSERKGRLFRARHETVNARLKIFNLFNTAFRHDVNKHGVCFHAAINMTQIALQSGEGLFDVHI